jgi:hypothetical protein
MADGFAKPPAAPQYSTGNLQPKSGEADLISPSHVASIVIAAASFIPFAAPARADAIDGDWCAKDGRHFFIQGPAITTPGGKAIQGNYRRHSFSYVVPPGETNAASRSPCCS